MHSWRPLDLVLHAVIAAFDFVSHGRMLPIFCAGMVQATVSTLGKNRGGTLWAQANVCSHTPPMALLPLSFQGNEETSRPKNLSVPRADQAKRRARSLDAGAIQAGEVEPWSHGSRAGSESHKLTPWVALAPLRLSSAALVVESVGEHASCVEMDTGIECVGVLVKAHGQLLEWDEPS